MAVTYITPSAALSANTLGASSVTLSGVTWTVTDGVMFVVIRLGSALDYTSFTLGGAGSFTTLLAETDIEAGESIIVLGKAIGSTGSGDLVATASTSGPILFAAAVFGGCDQTTPFDEAGEQTGTAAASTTVAASAVTVAANNALVGAMAYDDDNSATAITAANDIDTVETETAGFHGCAVGWDVSGVGGSLVAGFSWTGNRDAYAFGIEVNAAAAASGSGPLINAGLIGPRL